LEWWEKDSWYIYDIRGPFSSLKRFISLARRRANDDDGDEEKWRTGLALLKLDWNSYPRLLGDLP